MKVNDPNYSALASAEASRAQSAAQATGTARAIDPAAEKRDDVHLSELVRSLRSLATDSPERQAHLEEIARSYASGSYKVDPQALAGAILDDAIKG